MTPAGSPSAGLHLPAEHGAWALFAGGLVAGVGVAPGPWQVAAGAGWLALFLLRPPLSRLLQGSSRPGLRREVVLWLTLALPAWLAVAWGRPASLEWLLAAAPPGALLLGRRRAFLRSLGGEILSVLALGPLVPSLASAGGEVPGMGRLLLLWSAWQLYLLVAVVRVRGGRRHLGEVTCLLVGGAFTLLLGGVALRGGVSRSLLLGALPAALAGVLLPLLPRRRPLPAARLGVLEALLMLPFLAGVLLS